MPFFDLKFEIYAKFHPYPSTWVLWFGHCVRKTPTCRKLNRARHVDLNSVPSGIYKFKCDLLRNDWESFVAAMGYLFLLLHSATENSAQLCFSLILFFYPNHFAKLAALRPGNQLFEKCLWYGRGSTASRYTCRMHPSGTRRATTRASISRNRCRCAL